MKPNPPLVYFADDTLVIQTLIRDQLTAEGLELYNPGSANNPENPTSFIGGFKCAVLDLEAREGKDDPIDTADLLRVYQPNLPVAFLHENASDKLVKRAALVGPTFKKPDELAQILAWVLDCVRA
ncbi:MAG: hypothetical protein ACLQVI_04035 [Polyangiaceae bacterium]